MSARFAVALALVLAVTADAAVPAGFTDALFVSVGNPTDLTFTPDGRMLVTSQGGTLRVYSAAAALLGSQSFPASQICSNSERGLLGVAVDPSFASNGFVYLYYTRRKPGGDASADRRAQAGGDRVAEDEELDRRTSIGLLVDLVGVDRLLAERLADHVARVRRLSLQQRHEPGTGRRTHHTDCAGDSSGGGDHAEPPGLFTRLRAAHIPYL